MPDAPRKKHGKKRQKSKGAVNWHHRGISSITKKEIQRLMESLRDKAGPVAANHALSILRAMYNKAIEWEVFDKANPAAAIDKYEVASRERFLKREELQRFFKVLSEEPNANARDFVLLSLYTGARRRTVGAMRWQDIDLDARLWFVAGKITKTKKPYVVPLSMPAVALLRARMPKDADGWVFPSAKAKSGHIEDPRKPWERVRKNAGITDVILHDLRRTLGSWQAITGSSLPIIGKSLGHKDAQSTEVYAHLVVDPVRQSVETATNAMLVAAGVKATAEVKPLKKRRAA
ncbi:MAG TPA: site-specific integrase [Burkholderiales bacterium]|nr:site-specific integrase [Burkholderiales bacterium]